MTKSKLPEQTKSTKISDNKLYLSKREKDFLTEYAQTFDVIEASKTSKLYWKPDGDAYHITSVRRRTRKLLRMKIAQEYITDLHKEIFSRNVHIIEKAVNETYNLYQILLEKKSYAQANIAYERYVNLLGFTRPEVSFNQQINSTEEGGIVINYIVPNDPNKTEKTN